VSVDDSVEISLGASGSFETHEPASYEGNIISPSCPSLTHSDRLLRVEGVEGRWPAAVWAKSGDGGNEESAEGIGLGQSLGEYSLMGDLIVIKSESPRKYL
jgi:hypothetical protein